MLLGRHTSGNCTSPDSAEPLFEFAAPVPEVANETLQLAQEDRLRALQGKTVVFVTSAPGAAGQPRLLGGGSDGGAWGQVPPSGYQ